MADRINYTNKEQGQVSTEPVQKRWNFGDANEVKSVINSHADDIEALQVPENVEDLSTTNTDTSDILRPNGANGLEWIPNPTGVFFQNNLVLDGTENINRFIFNGTSNVTVTLPLESTIASDYLVYVENQTTANGRTVTLTPSGGDTIVGTTILNRGDLVSIERSNVSEFTVNVLQSGTFVQEATGEGTKIWSVPLNDWVESQVISTDPLWTYDPDTTASDPGVGFVKFDNIVITNATKIYINDESKQGVNYGMLFDLFTTNSIGRAIQWNNIASGITFEVTGLTDNGGWHTFDINVLFGQSLIGIGTIDIDFDILKLADQDTGVIYINDLSDFPTPVGGVITLDQNDTVYIVTNQVDLIANRLLINADRVKIEGLGSSNASFTSTTSGDLITIVNRDLILQKITLSCPNAPYVINSTGTQAEILSLFNVSFDNCQDLILANDLLAFIDNGIKRWDNFDNGVLLSGNINNILMQGTLIANFTGVAVDLNEVTSLAIDISEIVAYVPVGSTFLEIAPNGANISSGGEGSIRANKIIDLGGTPIVGYDTLESEWAVILNTVNIRDSDRLSPTGWGFYVDSLATPTQVIGTTPVKLSIDGLGGTTNESYLPTSIRGLDSLWDTTNDIITPISEGDSYVLRLDFEVTADSGNPSYIEIELDIGGGGSPTTVIVDRIVSSPKNPPYPISVSFSIFTLSTFLANGGQFFLSTDTGTITIADRQILITRESSGAS